LGTVVLVQTLVVERNSRYRKEMIFY